MRIRLLKDGLDTLAYSLQPDRQEFRRLLEAVSLDEALNKARFARGQAEHRTNCFDLSHRGSFRVGNEHRSGCHLRANRHSVSGKRCREHEQRAAAGWPRQKRRGTCIA